MVSFQNPVIQYLVIPSGATSGARIVIDGVRGLVLVYDAFSELVASVAGQPFLNDGFGNFIYPGVTAYDETVQLVAVELTEGQVKFQPIGNPTQDVASIIGTNVLGEPANIAPVMQLISPNAGVAFAQTVLELWGQSPDGSSLQKFRLYDLSGADADVQVTGIIRYGQTTWVQPALNAGWANTGSGFGNFAYRRNALGGVEFTGLIQWNSAATPAPDPVFTLPVGFRPDRNVNIGAQSSPGPGTNPTTETFQITSGGVVQVTNYSSGPNTPISFENVAFYLTGAH